MAQPCCVHVQECWVRPKPAALTHSSSESAWQHRAQLSTRTASQEMLMAGTASVAQACISALAHNIYPACCKSYLSLLPNYASVWEQAGSRYACRSVFTVHGAPRRVHHTPPALNMSQPILAEDNRANMTRRKMIPNHFAQRLWCAYSGELKESFILWKQL